jgi:hypothetical protein
VRRTLPEVDMGETNREAAVLSDPAVKDALLTQAASAKNKES